MVVVVLYLIGMRMTKEDNRVRDEELLKLTDMLDDIHMDSPYKSEPKAVKKKTRRRTVKALPKKKLKVVKKKTIKKKVVKKRKTT